MIIRTADHGDMAAIDRLLRQVLDVHQKGRPDLFRSGSKKYTDEELAAVLKDAHRPIFVAVDEVAGVVGYAFCILEETKGNNILQDSRVLYIDDLCVDEAARGRHIGQKLYEFVVDYAKSQQCDRLTLNVWSCNASAMRFYEKMGLVPYRVGMELRL